jgi:hypothetical protein
LRSSSPGGYFQTLGSGITTQYQDFDTHVWRSNAGTERLRITSAGLVGVGTGAPTAALDIVVPNAGGIVTGVSNFRYTSLSQVGSSASAIFGGGVIASGTNEIAKTVSLPGHFVKITQGVGITFHTGFAGAPGATASDTAYERLRITSAGNVGIGTTSPQQLLHLNGSSGAQVQFTDSGTGASATDGLRVGWNGTQGQIYLFENADLRFATNDQERARIDSSGRLLVGTSSNLNSNARCIIQSNTDSATGAAALDLRLGTTRPAAANTSIGIIRFSSTSQTVASNVYAQISAASDGASSSDADIPGRLTFSTTADGASSPTARMTIKSSGQVQIPGDIQVGLVGYISETGPDSGAYTINLGVTPNSTYSASRSVSIWTNGSGVVSFPRLTVKGDGAVVMPAVYADTVGATNRDLYIDSNGNLGYVSSIRESKSNIADITDVDWLYRLNPVSFNRRKKDDQENYIDETYSELEYGLIAEDVEAIAPELCFYDDVDGVQELRGIHYSKLIAPLLKAVQDLKEENESLKARVAALESA